MMQLAHQKAMPRKERMIEPMPTPLLLDCTRGVGVTRGTRTLWGQHPVTRNLLRNADVHVCLQSARARKTYAWNARKSAMRRSSC